MVVDFEPCTYIQKTYVWIFLNLINYMLFEEVNFKYNFIKLILK